MVQATLITNLLIDLCGREFLLAPHPKDEDGSEIEDCRAVEHIITWGQG